jgi:hypothetical protein
MVHKQCQLGGRSQRGPGEITVVDWLRKAAQSKRLPSIVKATWGERALLNSDIGLGPDTKPPAAGSLAQGYARPAKEWTPSATPLSGTVKPESERSSLAHWVTAASVLLLAFAGFLALRRKSASIR